MGFESGIVRVTVAEHSLCMVYDVYMSSQRYPISLKKEARNLRLKGKSYTQIMKILNLRSKGTVSKWLSGLELNSKAKLLLKQNNEKVFRNGLIKANKERSKRINLENLESFIYGKNKIHKINIRDLSILGTALYWGEGTKSEGKTPASCVLAFTNSDPLMVSVFMRFLRLVMAIPEDRIRGGVHLYDSVDRTKAINFWSQTAKIPKDRIYIS